MRLSARIWDRMYRGTPSWELGSVDPVLSSALDANAITAGRAIDLGCGTGDNAIELARRGLDVIGADVSQRALARARAKADAAGVSIEFVEADVTRLPPLGAFDLVVDRGLLMSLAGEGARRRYAEMLKERCASGGQMYSTQWVLPDEHRRNLAVWSMSRLPAAVLRLDEMDERFGDSFAIETLHWEIRSVDDPWLRRWGLRRITNVSYWLRRSAPRTTARRPPRSRSNRPKIG
jgi:SAM-dependent methyltransferase